ncbi:MAG: hypothetical protein QXZ09_07035 [Candidatus Methanomethylicaceae archaeon]
MISIFKNDIGTTLDGSESVVGFLVYSSVTILTDGIDVFAVISIESNEDLGAKEEISTFSEALVAIETIMEAVVLATGGGGVGVGSGAGAGAGGETGAGIDTVKNQVKLALLPYKSIIDT